MNNYAKATNADTENTTKKNITSDVSKNKLELFKRALSDGLSRKIDKSPEESLNE